MYHRDWTPEKMRARYASTKSINADRRPDMMQRSPTLYVTPMYVAHIRRQGLSEIYWAQLHWPSPVHHDLLRCGHDVSEELNGRLDLLVPAWQCEGCPAPWVVPTS